MWRLQHAFVLTLCFARQPKTIEQESEFAWNGISETVSDFSSAAKNNPNHRCGSPPF